MSKTYDLLVEKIQNTILDKMNEDIAPAQAAPAQQPQMPAQPAAPQPVAQEVPAEQPAEGEQQGVDEVDMSEIQELSGQLAQMLRDFKATQEDGGVEACKFAAGMVVAAAIDGLDYKDRKDILKKLKAGEFNSAEEEPTEEPIEAAPAEEPQVAETLLSRRNDKEDRDLRMADKKRGNKIRKSSPFTSPVNESDGSATTVDIAKVPGEESSAISNGEQEAEKSGSQLTVIDTLAPNKANNAVEKTIDSRNVSDAISGAKQGFTMRMVDQQQQPVYTAESYIMTKKQLEQVRLHEISFSKGELEELNKTVQTQNSTLNAVRDRLVNNFFNNWDTSTHEPTDELSRAIRILNSKSTDRSVNQEILRNAVVPYFLGLSNGSEEINDIETLNNYITNGGKTENLVIVKVGNVGAVIDFNIANNIVNKYIRNARLSK